MDAAAGQLPDQPTVDGAEQELAGFRAALRAGHVIQQPADLGARKVRVEQESGSLAEERLHAISLESLTDPGADPTLPDDRRMDGSAGGAVPDDGRLALV